MLNGVGNRGIVAVPQSQEANASAQYSQEIDQKEAATAPKFGDIYNQIQAKYGQRAEKPREIKKTLGKDDFLKLMMTQMKNQDPTNPFKAEQMAAQVAQFTSVEQLQNVNQNLNKIGNQNKPMEQMIMTNMIGKTVTIDRERFPHAEGENETLSFTLPKAAESSRVSVIAASGEEIFHKDLGKQNAGELNLIWDGLKNNGQPSKAGDYTLKIEAKDERGQNISLNQQAQAHVIGVSFEGLEPVLLVGDANRQEKITMRNIVRVNLDQAQMARLPGVEGVRKVGSSNANFIPFPGPIQPAVANQDNEKGFPNGLKETETAQVERR
jgi:flagellar basal-body rod modification protein FlgD